MCGEISVHKFKESLAFSHEAEDLPIWKDVYKKALHSIGVPPSVLYPAIDQELRISFEAFEIAQ